MLEIRYDKQKLKRLDRELRRFPRAMPKVMSRALNRTATSARTQMARSLSQQTGIKVGDVRKRLYHQKATYRYWRSGVIVSQKRLSLSYLKPRKTARGMTVKHGKKRVKIAGAFEALKGFFIRMPVSSGYSSTIGVSEALDIDSMQKVRRLPIARIKGPVLARVFASAQDQANRIYSQSLARLEKNISDQVRLILGRRIPA